MVAQNQEDIVINIRAKIAQLKAKVKEAKKTVKQLDRPNIRSYNRIAKAQQNVANTQKKLDKAMGKEPPFQGWALSLMFFGMALQRMFSTISKAAISTFQEISHQAGVATTASDMLNGSMKYLQFNIGQALQPVLTLLVPIVDKIATWVEENQKLAAGLLVALGIMGTFLTVLGMLVLSALGFVGAWAKLAPILTPLKAAIAGLAVPFWAVAAIVIGIIAMWKTNFGGFRDFIKAVFGNIFDAIKGVFKGIKDVVKGIWMVIEGIFEGDAKKAFNGLLKIVQGIIKAILSVFLNLGAGIVNIFIFAINFIKDLFFGFIRLWIDGIKTSIELINRIPGVNIGTAGFQTALDALDSLKEGTDIGYLNPEAIQGVNEWIQNINIEVQGNMDSDAAREIADGINRASPGGM